jgi:hypothetical protein
MSMRLRFVQDDSSHWYAIPADFKAAFARWIESCADDAPAYSGLTFENFRIDGYPGFYTFTDLQEDK